MGISFRIDCGDCLAVFDNLNTKKGAKGLGSFSKVANALYSFAMIVFVFVARN